MTPGRASRLAWSSLVVTAALVLLVATLEVAIQRAPGRGLPGGATFFNVPLLVALLAFATDGDYGFLLFWLLPLWLVVTSFGLLRGPRAAHDAAAAPVATPVR
jgi:hypothetical protein